MGSASSSPSPRPPADERTHLLAVSAEQITIARRQAALARREADAARADAANLLSEMAALEDRQKYYAALGASAFAIAIGGLGAVALLARRQQTAALTQAVQALADAKRHAALDLQKAKRFAAEPLAKALVPVFDNLDSLCDACSADAALDEGAQLTRSSLMAALQAQSIERVEPEEGTAFDPHVHEAMFTVEAEDGADANVISSVFRPGYVLHGERILRAAQVGVTK